MRGRSLRVPKLSQPRNYTNQPKSSPQLPGPAVTRADPRPHLCYRPRLRLPRFFRVIFEERLGGLKIKGTDYPMPHALPNGSSPQAEVQLVSSLSNTSVAVVDMVHANKVVGPSLLTAESAAVSFKSASLSLSLNSLSVRLAWPPLRPASISLDPVIRASRVRLGSAFNPNPILHATVTPPFERYHCS